MMVDIVLLDDLTDREMDILRFVAAGLSNQAIAKRLNISAETVKWHNKHVFSKLSAKNRTQAVAHARRLGVLVEDAHINNLPQLLTPFVGRAQELQQLVEFLENPELPLIIYALHIAHCLNSPLAIGYLKVTGNVRFIGAGSKRQVRRCLIWICRIWML
jgi:DNA-binding CsgD family transcriptional regulator